MITMQLFPFFSGQFILAVVGIVIFVGLNNGWSGFTASTMIGASPELEVEDVRTKSVLTPAFRKFSKVEGPQLSLPTLPINI